MSDCHFEAAVTGSAERDKVTEHVSVVNVGIVTTGVNVMYVKSAPARTAQSATVTAGLITVKDKLANARPVSPVLQALTAAPVGAILTDHIGYTAGSGAIPTAISDVTRERCKRVAAIGAGRNGVFLLRRVVACLRAVFLFGVKDCLATLRTNRNAAMLLAVLLMTSRATENLGGAQAVRFSLDGRSALEASFDHR